MKTDNFDESILDNEEEFKKRFKEIERPHFLNFVIDKSLREAKDLIDVDRLENEES